MVASTLVDLVKVYNLASGTGGLVLGSAVPGYRGKEALMSGATYSYSIQQEAEYELGKGLYLADGSTLIRTPLFSSNGGQPINLGQNAAVAFVASAEDLLSLEGTGGGGGGSGQPLVSTFMQLSGTTIPAGFDRIVTSGFERPGWGSAQYLRDPDQTTGTGLQPWRRQDGAGVWFVLDASNGVFAPSLGFDPNKTEAQNKSALDVAVAAAAARAVKVLRLGCAFFSLSAWVLGSAASGMSVDGRGAVISTSSDAPVVTISGDQIEFFGASISGNNNTMSSTRGVPLKPNQQGIRVDGAGYANIHDNSLGLLSFGFVAHNVATGFPLTGGFQQPSLFTSNKIRACAYGMQLDDGGTTGTYGEYFRASLNLVTDCTWWGLKCVAGNCSFENNSFMGNNGQVYLASSVGNAAPNNASNSDHGHFIGNTVNHGLRCGIYIENPLRGWIVTGNHVWAHFGKNISTGSYDPMDPTNGKLSDLTGITDGTQDYAYGLFTLGLHDSVIKNNKIRNNQVNAGHKFLSNGFGIVIRDNDFTADANYSRGQTVDWSDFFYSNGGNGLGPNAYFGVWKDTTTFPTNGDWNRWFEIGPSGIADFANGWHNYGNGFKTLAVRKDGFGVVHWRGLIAGGTLNAAVTTLPAKYTNFFSTGEGGADLYSGLTDGAAVAFQSRSDTRSIVIIAPAASTFNYVGLSGMQYWVQ